MLRRLSLIALLFAAIPLVAQTSSATATVTVIPAFVPATVTITPSTLTVQVGTTANLVVKATGTAATPTGNIELLGKAPGATVYTLINTFALVNGSVTCAYPVPATTPPAVYTIEAAYCGDNYTKSTDCQ